MELTFKLLNIECYVAEEKDGDEISIQYRGKKLWPQTGRYQKILNEVVPVNSTIKINQGDWVELELFEHDWLFKKQIGSFKFLADSKGGPYHTNIKAAENTMVRYSISWSIDK